MSTATKRDKFLALLFEIFCIWPAILLIAGLTVIFLVAISPIAAYYIIKKRWKDRNEARKDLEDSRKGSHRD